MKGGRQHEGGYWCTCAKTTDYVCVKCTERGVVHFMGKHRTRAQVVEKMLSFKVWKGATVQVFPPKPEPLLGGKLGYGYYLIRLGTAEMRIAIPPGDPAFAAPAKQEAA